MWIFALSGTVQSLADGHHVDDAGTRAFGG